MVLTSNVLLNCFQETIACQRGDTMTNWPMCLNSSVKVNYENVCLF